jgi:hypothetical protein
MWTGKILHGVDHTGVEFRNGKPWNGVVMPERDAKGRPLGHAMRFVEGRYIGDVE